jgi:hypothetical protein
LTALAADQPATQKFGDAGEQLIVDLPSSRLTLSKAALPEACQVLRGVRLAETRCGNDVADAARAVFESRDDGEATAVAEAVEEDRALLHDVGSHRRIAPKVNPRTR